MEWNFWKMLLKYLSSLSTFTEIRKCWKHHLPYFYWASNHTFHSQKHVICIWARKSHPSGSLRTEYVHCYNACIPSTLVLWLWNHQCFKNQTGKLIGNGLGGWAIGSIVWLNRIGTTHLLFVWFDGWFRVIGGLMLVSCGWMGLQEL